jgi:hypothetical protein
MEDAHTFPIALAAVLNTNLLDFSSLLTEAKLRWMPEKTEDERRVLIV